MKRQWIQDRFLNVKWLKRKKNKIDLNLLNLLIMPSYDTVSQAVTGLKERGYSLDFNLKANSLECQGQKFNPMDFEITEFYRFEGNSDPGDEAVVYAIESRTGLKGVLVN